MTVQALLLRRHLSKGLSGARDQKNRVVAEARLPAPLRHDLAATFAFEELSGLLRSGQRQHADKARVPRPRLSLEPHQELCSALFLRWAKARRANAREASQRLDFHARVI